MKRFILAFSIFSVWLAIVSIYYMCVINGQCSFYKTEDNLPITNTIPPLANKKAITISTNIDDIVSAEKTIDSLTLLENEITSLDTLKISGLKVYDNDYLLKTYYSNFKIFQNSTNVRIPLGISEYGYVIAKHMDSVNKALTIKGYYNQDETVEKGLQRAKFIKERLTQLGIPAVLINTTSVPAVFNYNYDKFTGGIQFDFKKTDSVFKLNKIDYSLFQNSQDNLKGVADINHKQETTIEEIKITDADIDAITKKDPVVVTPNKIKENLTPSESEKITYTVTSKDFKNKKFKASRNLKKFIETHKEAKKIQLIGYSNASVNSNENYTKGLELADIVNRYIVNKGIYTGKTITNALRNKKSEENNTIKEGVTLIIH